MLSHTYSPTPVLPFVASLNKPPSSSSHNTSLDHPFIVYH